MGLIEYIRAVWNGKYLKGEQKEPGEPVTPEKVTELIPLLASLESRLASPEQIKEIQTLNRRFTALLDEQISTEPEYGKKSKSYTCNFAGEPYTIERDDCGTTAHLRGETYTIKRDYCRTTAHPYGYFLVHIIYVTKRKDQFDFHYLYRDLKSSRSQRRDCIHVFEPDYFEYSAISRTPNFFGNRIIYNGKIMRDELAKAIFSQIFPQVLEEVTKILISKIESNKIKEAKQRQLDTSRDVDLIKTYLLPGK